jgi:hypothetical protein
MKRWTEWEIIRRQVAIAGFIVDQQNQPVGSVRITITAKAGKFKKQVENASLMAGGDWETLKKRPDQTLSRLDGLYFFLNLPEGQYTVSAMDPRTGKSVESHVTVSKDKSSIAPSYLRLPAL